MALTKKQRLFVNAKAAGATNKEAAQAAGYAESSASAAGSRLAKHHAVAAELEKLKSRQIVNNADGSANQLEDDEAGDDKGGEYLPELAPTDDPLAWLLALMNEPKAKVFDRRNAAQKAVDFIHSKKGEKGKKEQVQDKANEISSGRFGLRQAGKLRSVK